MAAGNTEPTRREPSQTRDSEDIRKRLSDLAWTVSGGVLSAILVTALGSVVLFASGVVEDVPWTTVTSYMVVAASIFFLGQREWWSSERDTNIWKAFGGSIRFASTMTAAFLSLLSLRDLNHALASAFGIERNPEYLPDNFVGFSLISSTIFALLVAGCVYITKRLRSFVGQLLVARRQAKTTPR